MHVKPIPLNYVARDIQLALELIVAQVEVGQLDEVAELLGQFTCTKSGMSAKRTNACMMGHTNLTVEAHSVQDELLELDKDPRVQCNRPAQFIAGQVEFFEISEGRK